MQFLKSIILQLIPEKLIIKLRYKKEFGAYPDLKNPKKFTEKIQWLKLYDKDPLKAICSDKFKVREFIANTIGDEYLIPLCFQTKNVEDICAEKLPEYPVIIKPNHDSGGGIVIRDKNQADYQQLQNQLKHRLMSNYYHYSGEWEYKDIEPRLVVEKLIYDDNNDKPLLNDYKIHCFNGEPKFIQTIFDREKNLSETWYDIDWAPQEFSYFSENKCISPRPKNLERMLSVSRNLAQNFKYVRVDLYNIHNNVLFGELTFHPFCGVMRWKPEKWDNILGDMLKI